MKRLAAFSLLIWITLNGWSNPLHIQLAHSIIIDTDCAVDDMRAISLLLSRPEITIKAILLSDGSLSPDEGFEKVKALLQEFNSDTIPVAIGKVQGGVNPPWRQFNRQVSWGTASGQRPERIDAVTLLNEKLSRENEKITLVCLGALTNISQLIRKDASIASKIERIIWYNTSAEPLSGFNYERDKPAADLVLHSGIRIDMISNLQKEEAIFDTSFYTACEQANNRLSKVLQHVYSQPAVHERLIQRHFRLCDDLVAVYLTKPELFNIDILKNDSRIRYNRDYNIPAVKEVIEDMIRGEYVPGESVVFKEFPKNREMFTYDVRQIMDSAIARYGPDEWKANVMTDEFHGHLGVFSIIGAKMGIKARELFHADHDELEVVTFAGTKPPYSCLNDGIQVSTGATLGMGTIHLAGDSITKPVAVFTYKDRSIRLSLKPEYLKKINDDIREGIVKFGLTDEGYWHLVRRNAIRYWLDWDRNEIFDIRETQPQPSGLK
jgi:pyrimidine-specific ribonucleoside hydrolase